MTIIAFDFETTGLPLFKERSIDPRQPHIVQMAILAYSEAGVELDHECVIVKPDGWVISPEVTKIHGISHEQAMDVGIPEKDAAAMFLVAMVRASLRVAHNIAFDLRIARIAMSRAGYQREMIEALEARPEFCTCNASKPLVKLPPTEKMRAVGFTGFKSPSLQECMSHFFQEEIDGAHDALVDARCSGRIYWHLKSLGKNS